MNKNGQQTPPKPARKSKLPPKLPTIKEPNNIYVGPDDDDTASWIGDGEEQEDGGVKLRVMPWSEQIPLLESLH